MLDQASSTVLSPEAGERFEFSEQSTRTWRIYGSALLAAIVLVLALFWETAVSIVAIWWRSETFAHGFLIVPISLLLIWGRRAELMRLRPQSSLWGPAFVLAIGFGWLLAHLADVIVVQQLALVAMLPALVIGLLGFRVAREMTFPLAYLIFAVPMGEVLIPPMMDFTAAFTVKLLQLSGIPVYWEGLFFTIPSGSWSVVEGCSGVRYLIASLALGSLYAYLIYHSYWRRGAFMALSIVFPIIANGLRAYMIVMIAHLSDMRLALGIDHYIYGWVFFGLVMLLMFWIGSFWREDRSNPRVDIAKRANKSLLAAPDGIKPITVTIASVLAVALWPAAAHYLNAPLRGSHAQVVLQAPIIDKGWEKEDTPIASWTPRYLDMDAQLQQTYRKDARKVGLYLAYYSGQGQGGKLISTQNVMVIQKHPVWQQPTQRKWPVSGIDRIGQVYQTQLRSPQRQQNLLAWHWYWVADRHTANPYWGKLLKAYARLTGWHTDSAGIVIYTEYNDRREDAVQVLQTFLRDALPAVEAALRQAETRYSE